MPLHSSKYNWFFKYKLYHLPFWFAYHCLWWTVNSGSLWGVVNGLFFSPYVIKFSFYVVFQALGVYFNLYYLIPKFLEKGKYVQYIGLLILTMLCVAVLILPGYYAGAWWSDQTFQELYGTDPGNYFHFLKANTLASSVASMTLAMSIKLTKNWIQANRKQQMLEKEKLETELKFLKSQFNPHFLFNNLNSIFVLIHKDPSMASEFLVKFSDLLRYQLYECNEQQIPLNRELDYLENFIELAKLRLDYDNLKLILDIEPPPSGKLTIAPFLLMPFIENAFKHVSQRKDQLNWIKMKLSFHEQLLHFDIANSISRQNVASSEILYHGGIGLKNVQRRLDLMYPGQYELVIQKEDAQFKVKLQINLHEQTVQELVPILIRS